MIPLKSEKDLVMMRGSARILAGVMEKIRQEVKAGITTEKLNLLAEKLIRNEGAQAAFKGYKGYPASICTSVNEEIVHGIPGARTLKEGDIISLDLGVNYQGYFSDLAITVGIGRIDPKARALIEITKKALSEGIKQARPDNRLSDISYAIQSYVERNGFSVVREFVGHGIGTSLHEEPEVPNFGKAGLGPVLKNGMVLAIEPMVNMGGWESRILENGWTAVTKDRLGSAHFEHT
ncbi:MAG: type I methionyl aminopeptidase, partial [Candidatus Omnitrophica bacterium]|nr:type I methionyl aminopeptidase [Candidatus Omnitrophota bacterium]